MASNPSNNNYDGLSWVVFAWKYPKKKTLNFIVHFELIQCISSENNTTINNTITTTGKIHNEKKNQ